MSYYYIHAVANDGQFFDDETEKCQGCGKKFSSAMIERQEIKLLKEPDKAMGDSKSQVTSDSSSRTSESNDTVNEASSDEEASSEMDEIARIDEAVGLE